MVEVVIKIIEFTNESQPGWIRCVLKDAFDKEFFFTEKVPVVTLEDLDKKSVYPQSGAIRCSIIKTNQDQNLIEIDTSQPDGVSSEDGSTRFTVFSHQLIN